jgi:hypothetical protein
MDVWRLAVCATVHATQPGGNQLNLVCIGVLMHVLPSG